MPAPSQLQVASGRLQNEDGQLQGPLTTLIAKLHCIHPPFPMSVARRRPQRQRQPLSGIQSKTIPLSPTHLPSTTTTWPKSALKVSRPQVS